MNEKNVPSMARESEGKIKDMLSYQSQLYAGTQNEFKELYGAIERLDRIANRLNSTEYPKNNVEPVCKNDENEIGLRNKPVMPDGLVGFIGAMNQANGANLDELKYRILPGILLAIEYIEQHI